MAQARADVPGIAKHLRGTPERQYLDLLGEILRDGVDRPDRTGVGTRAVFGRTMRFDLQAGFPAVTTKRLAFKQVKAELLWFIRGSSNVYELHRDDTHIWDGNAFDAHWVQRARFPGDAGRNYGQQWRDWATADGRHVDQLREAIRLIREQPYARRIVVNAWNPGEIEHTCLPPCHAFFQFFVANGRLSLAMYQRSADMFLGVPFNIAQYALLLHMVAQVTDLEAGELFHVLADAHVYHSHFDAVRSQLAREPLPPPTLWLNPRVDDIDAFTMEDLKLVGYRSHPAIAAEMAV